MIDLVGINCNSYNISWSCPAVYIDMIEIENIWPVRKYSNILILIQSTVQASQRNISGAEREKIDMVLSGIIIIIINVVQISKIISDNYIH